MGFEFYFPFPQLKRASNHRTSNFIGCTAGIEPPKDFLFDGKLKAAYYVIFCLHEAVVLLCRWNHVCLLNHRPRSKLCSKLECLEIKKSTKISPLLDLSE